MPRASRRCGSRSPGPPTSAPAPTYTIDSAWMAKVKQTAQWAVDAGMYVFVNTHHEADGNGGWVTFPSSTSAAQSVAAEVTRGLDADRDGLPSVRRPPDVRVLQRAQRGRRRQHHDGADGSQHVPGGLLQGDPRHRRRQRHPHRHDPAGGRQPHPVGHPVDAEGELHQRPQSHHLASHLLPDELRPEQTPYAWGSSSDYTSMQNSIAQQIRVWLPTQADRHRRVGLHGRASDGQPSGARAGLRSGHDDGGPGSRLVGQRRLGTARSRIFNRTSGAQTYPTIVSGIMTGVANGLAAANNWATLANP